MANNNGAPNGSYYVPGGAPPAGAPGMYPAARVFEPRQPPPPSVPGQGPPPQGYEQPAPHSLSEQSQSSFSQCSPHQPHGQAAAYPPQQAPYPHHMPPQPPQQYAYPAQYPYAPPGPPPYYGAPQYPQQAPPAPAAWSAQVPPHLQQQQQHGYPHGGYHQQTGYGAPAGAPYGHVQPQQQGYPPYGYAQPAQPAPPPPAAHASAPYTARPGLETWKKEAQDAFVRADLDGSRSLDPRELMEVLQRLGYSINYPEALRLFGSVDTNQDGKIRMHEFVHLYVTLKANHKYP